MSEFLKGNFQTKQTVKDVTTAEDDLESRFEREAMKRLGGSIAFVSKKKVMWAMDAETPGDGKKCKAVDSK